MKKFLAELFGTMMLVLIGCGTAVVTGGLNAGLGTGFVGVLAISMAFGISIVLAAYSIGPVSGAHLNPAVSFAMLLDGRLSFGNFIGYVVSQVAGAFAGSGIIYFLSQETGGLLSGTGANGFGELSAVKLSMVGAIAAEVVLTMIFVWVILEVTRSEKNSAVAGIVIGLSLAGVHLIGIPLTGTSVNPARSLAPAVFAAGTALEQVWVFLVAPMAGSLLAWIFHKITRNEEPKLVEAEGATLVVTEAPKLVKIDEQKLAVNQEPTPVVVEEPTPAVVEEVKEEIQEEVKEQIQEQNQ